MGKRRQPAHPLSAGLQQGCIHTERNAEVRRTSPAPAASSHSGGAGVSPSSFHGGPASSSTAPDPWLGHLQPPSPSWDYECCIPTDILPGLCPSTGTGYLRHQLLELPLPHHSSALLEPSLSLMRGDFVCISNGLVQVVGTKSYGCYWDLMKYAN